jgi:hypothetical protein
MPSSGIFLRVALLRTDISEERSASIIKVKMAVDDGFLILTSRPTRLMPHVVPEKI